MKHNHRVDASWKGEQVPLLHCNDDDVYKTWGTWLKDKEDKEAATVLLLSVAH